MTKIAASQIFLIIMFLFLVCGMVGFHIKVKKQYNIIDAPINVEHIG
jgi:hypothetical protein